MIPRFILINGERNQSEDLRMTGCEERSVKMAVHWYRVCQVGPLVLVLYQPDL